MLVSEEINLRPCQINILSIVINSDRRRLPKILLARANIKYLAKRKEVHSRSA